MNNIVIFDIFFREDLPAVFTGLLGIFRRLPQKLGHWWYLILCFDVDIDVNYFPTGYLLSFLILHEVFFIFTGLIVLSHHILVVFIEFANVVAAILLVDATLSMLHIVLELPVVPLPIFIEVEAFAVLFVFNPVSDVELSFKVVIFSLTVFHSVLKLALIAFLIGIDEDPPPIELPVEEGASIHRPIWHFELVNVGVLVTGL